MRNLCAFSFLLLFLSVNAGANIPLFRESYLERREILTIPAEPFQKQNSSWEAVKLGQLHFLAEILVLYPSDTHFYFLARDAEYLYDFAQLALAGTRDLDRVHLLNVSRRNVDSKNLGEYLNANNISESQLRAGRRILLIDSGFFGNIIRAIQIRFPDQLWQNIKGQLLQSASYHTFPSSRAFLEPVFKNDAESEMQINDYEALPKKNLASVEFIKKDGTYHPISPMRVPVLNWYYSYRSLRLRKDLVAYWKNPDTQRYLNFVVSQFIWIKHQLELHGHVTNTQLPEKTAAAFAIDFERIRKLSSFPAAEPNPLFIPKGISLCVLVFHKN